MRAVSYTKFAQEGGLINYWLSQEMDNLNRMRTNMKQQQQDVFPLNLANYQAPIGIYIVSNIIALVVFLLERLFPPNRTISKLKNK